MNGIKSGGNAYIAQSGANLSGIKIKWHTELGLRNKWKTHFYHRNVRASFDIVRYPITVKGMILIQNAAISFEWNFNAETIF
jgi:hypothetical protein